MAKGDNWHVGYAVFGSHNLPESERPIRTSLNHPLQIATIPVGETAEGLALPSAPEKGAPRSLGGPWHRDLNVDVAVIREWGASSVLTLLEAHEFDLLHVRSLPDAVRGASMAWLHAPILDVSVPGPAFDASVEVD